VATGDCSGGRIVDGAVKGIEAVAGSAFTVAFINEAVLFDVT